MALCGGVSCIIEPGMFVALSKAQMISPGGSSKPFSSEADGYGRGEGCGVVLLKPLEDVSVLTLTCSYKRCLCYSYNLRCFLCKRPLKTTTKFGASSAKRRSTKMDAR